MSLSVHIITIVIADTDVTVQSPSSVINEDTQEPTASLSVGDEGIIIIKWNNCITHSGLKYPPLLASGSSASSHGTTPSSRKETTTARKRGILSLCKY